MVAYRWHGLIRLYPTLLFRRSAETLRNVTFHASYTTDLDADSSAGDPVPTSTVGSPQVSGGYLILDDASNQVTVNYDSVGNSDVGQIGAIRMLLRTNYSGIPSSTQHFFHLTGGSGVIDEILIEHIQVSGRLDFIIRDEGGAGTVVIQANWSPTSGTTHELELNWDWTSGVNETRAFVDKTQFQSTVVNSPLATRGNDNTLMRLAPAGVGTDPNFDVDDFKFFDAVQHTADYTP